MAQETASVQPILPPDEALTPREIHVRRVSMVLMWGAVANGIAAALVLLVGVLAALRATPDLYASIHHVLLARFTGADDISVIIVLLLLLTNVGGLLIVMVGALAQETWSLVLGVIWLVANVAAFGLLGFTPALVTLAVGLWSAALIARDLSAFRLNPVMLKELRGRMRGMRAFVVITVYLGLMSAVTVLIYLISTPLTKGQSAAVTGDLGRTLFAWVVGIELLLIIFIAPAFTSGAITGERERKTYDLLQTTLLPSASFVVGKLESSLSYILLLLLAAIPLQSIAFLFGGVSELELVMAFVILVVTAVALGTVGLYFSSSVDRTLTASVRAYTVALVITFGIPLIMSLVLNFYGNALTGSGTGIANSPVLETILIYVGLLLTSLNPIATGLYTQYMLTQKQQLGFVTVTLNSNGSLIPLVSPWVSFTIIYLITSAILIALSIRRVRRTET
jgi:hypothetical protein